MTFELLLLDGPQAGRRVRMNDTRLTFGRSADAAMRFPQDSFMSSLHLAMQAGPGGVALFDLRSTNGTFLNGQRVSQAVAAPGDVIKIGGLSLQVNVAAYELIRPAPSAPQQAATLKPETAKAKLLRSFRAFQTPLYCLLDAAIDPGILAELMKAQSDTLRHSLYDGRSAVTLANWAPYLLPLTPDSPLLEWIIEKGWGKSWASFFTSAASFDELRKHFRKFLMVQVDGVGEVYFRFYDPRVLRDYLRTTTPHDQAVFFGPTSEWFLESEKEETLLRVLPSPRGFLTQVVSLGVAAA